MNGVKKLKGGNDAKMERLPSRFAMATITKGATSERVMNDYAKCPDREPPELPAYTRPMGYAR